MISKKMKYALKALIEIGKTEDKFAKANVIAENAKISSKFLGQILTELRKGRILSSKQGYAGGYFFLRDPKEVTLADVFRLIDGPIALISCASVNFYEPCDDCPDEKLCSIHHALVYVRDETLKVLEKMTIDDLIYGDFSSPIQSWIKD